MSLNVKRAKTETLSLRLDPKTKFMLEFLARIQGQSITTIVERAVKETAGKVGIESIYGNEKTWIEFWDPSEGMRLMAIFDEPNYPTDFEEDELLRFAKTHWPFFYTDKNANSLRRPYVDLLWPKRETYLNLWRDQRQSNYWAAGEAMTADLLAAKVQPPEWPTGSKGRSAPTGPRETFSADLDDEIPF
jgi:uncharacterized protein (DUF1778 family)